MFRGEPMILRRLLAPLAVLLAGGVALAPSAQAAPAYPPTVNGGLRIGTGADIDVGEIHLVVGVGFRANSRVSVTIDRQDLNGDPNVRGFAGAAPLAAAPLAAAPLAAAPIAPENGPLMEAHRAAAHFACVTASSCTENADGTGLVDFHVHFFNSHTHTITVSGVHPDGTPRILQATVVPETDCDESDGHPTEIADSTVVPDCDEASGVGGDPDGSGVGGDGALPNTGSSVGLPAALGAILVLGGAGLVTAVRRRRRGTAAA
jgi:LPXTG-motif cell wall-anchored protein